MKTKSLPFNLAVYAFIKYEAPSSKDNGKYLLIKRSESCKNFKGCWEAPGGKVDQGETFEHALKREIREETGLSVVLDGVAGVTDFVWPKDQPKFKVAALYMKAHTDFNDVKLSHEHKQYKWLLLSEFPKKLTPALRRVLENLRVVNL